MERAGALSDPSLKRGKVTWLESVGHSLVNTFHI